MKKGQRRQWRILAKKVGRGRGDLSFQRSVRRGLKPSWKTHAMLLKVAKHSIRAVEAARNIGARWAMRVFIPLNQEAPGSEDETL